MPRRLCIPRANKRTSSLKNPFASVGHMLTPLKTSANDQRAPLLWETAQGRVAWGGDLAIWSAHDGEDTLFNEFAREARAHLTLSHTLSHTSPPFKVQSSTFDVQSSPPNASTLPLSP